MRRRQFTTKYANDYGYSHSKQSKEAPKIFLYKKISELEYKLWLTEDAKKYLDNWLGLKDTNLQEAVLETLRSMNARFKINLITETEYK